METNAAFFKGCLLGMAVGDAMGAPIDGKRYEEICQMYGPAGLLGYDSANGLAQITSYTQIGLFAVNGMMVSAARGKTDADTLFLYVTRALKEWARMQHLPGSPERRTCWLCHIPQMRRRKCMDPRTLDALTRDALGTPQNPANQSGGPGTLTGAVCAGLFFHPDRMGFPDIGTLAARIVALTHGDTMAHLSGAALAYMIAGIIHDPDCPMKQQILHATDAVVAQFPGPAANRLNSLLRSAVTLSHMPQVLGVQAMEQLECNSAAQVLAGAVYAVLASNGDFDTAMITAVNHSGKSAAVGAVTGALLGAAQGEEALPDFYMDCLDCDHVIRELAGDLHTAFPKGWQKRLFDDDWDRKYTQGKPVERVEWEKA